MTPAPYALCWHVGDHPRLWLALKDGERVIAAGVSADSLAEAMAQAIASGKAEPARVPQEIRPEVTAYIRYRREAIASPAAERLRTALIMWGVMPRGAELEACYTPSPQASEKNR